MPLVGDSYFSTQPREHLLHDKNKMRQLEHEQEVPGLWMLVTSTSSFAIACPWSYISKFVSLKEAELGVAE